MGDDPAAAATPPLEQQTPMAAVAADGTGAGADAGGPPGAGSAAGGGGGALGSAGSIGGASEGSASPGAAASPDAAPSPDRSPEPPRQQQQQQQQQQSDYARFLDMLKHSSAQPVTAQLLEFVRRFPPGLPRNEAARRVHKFLTSTQEWMLSECVVFAADADEEGRNNAAEGLEKFLLSRLHQKIFATDPADKEEDARLQQRVASLAWVSFEHLGVPGVEPSLLALAISELQGVDNYKAPRDKLVCILNASRVINNVLKRTLEDSGVAGRPLSADDFLPLLIFSVLKANPPRLHSNVEFVAAFRHPCRLVAEDAYFLTALQSAIAFVKDATPKALEVSEDEFKRRCAACLAEYRSQQPLEGREPVGDDGADASATWSMGSSTSRENDASPSAGLQETEAPRRPAPATVAAKAAEMAPPARRALAEKVQALPMRFEAKVSARQLEINEISGLLEEYKEMAALLRGLGGGEAWG